MRSYLEKTLHKKRAGRVAQGVGPEFKPQYCQKKKKSNQEEWLSSGRAPTYLTKSHLPSLVRYILTAHVKST
jgi:hypothetical protein